MCVCPACTLRVGKSVIVGAYRDVTLLLPSALRMLSVNGRRRAEAVDMSRQPETENVARPLHCALLRVQCALA